MRKLRMIILGILAVCMGSCTDLLDKEPISQLSVNNLFNTEEGADAAVVGCYSFLYKPGYYWQERWVFAFEGTDISGNGGGSANYQWTAGENRWSDWWLTTYQAICACNVTITRLGMSAIDSDVKEKLLAEARFLRAFYYYHALTYWGGVPLLKDEISSLDEVKYVKRSSRKELADFIIEEAGDAAKILDKDPAVATRASKGAALMLKAKVQMWQEEWENAVKTCEEIKNLKKYDLFDNYSKVFSEQYENQKEHIFSVQFDPGYTEFSAHMLWYLGPSKDEWDKFNGLGGSSAPESFYEKYDEWDYRLEQNLAKTWRNQPFKDSRIAILKYWDRTGSQMLDHDGLNFPVYRYADVLLMYAEALNEWKKGPTTEAYEAVNEIRRRAGVDEIENYDYQKFKLFIQDERARELCYEGYRRFDLVRWGILVETVKKISKEINSRGDEYVDERHNLCPIPETEIIKNGNLEQNPGYETANK